MRSYRSVFLSILSSSLLILSFPTFNMWGFAWIALVPFILSVRHKSIIDTFLLSFLWGILFFYGVIYWLNSIAVMATIGLVFYLALYFVIFAFILRGIIKKDIPIFAKAVSIASAWAILEFVRSNLLTGFGWALLGYSQSSFLPVIQIADITGAYGVSFLIVFVNVVVYEFFFAETTPQNVGAIHELPLQTITRLAKNKLINLFLSIFLITNVFIYGFYKLNSYSHGSGNISVKISVVQGNIPQILKWDKSYRQEIIKKYFYLTSETKRLNQPDLIIWPETSFPADLETEHDFSEPLFELAKNLDSRLLIGANRFVWKNKYEYEKIYNSAFLIGPKGRVDNYYDKIHLVPFGEYMPVDKLPGFFFKFLPEKINMVGDFQAGETYTVFKIPLAVNKELAFSVLICFEDVFGAMARNFVKNGSRLLINITNDGWYGISSAPFQHAQASVFRAVENRVPVVRSANTGLSVFIDKKGKIFDGVKNENNQEIFIAGYKAASVSIEPSLKPTFYNRYGDIFIIICFLFLLSGIYPVFEEKRQQ